MALTLAKLSPNPDYVAGNKKVKFRTVTFDSSYLTGGELISASDVGLKKITFLSVEGVGRPTAGTTAWVVSYDPTAGSLQLFTQVVSGTSALALAECASTTNVATVVCRIRVEGY